MIELSLLITALAATFDWHGARIAFVSQCFVALIRVRTVNLTEIATAFCGIKKYNGAINVHNIESAGCEFVMTLPQITVV